MKQLIKDFVKYLELERSYSDRQIKERMKAMKEFQQYLKLEEIKTIEV